MNDSEYAILLDGTIQFIHTLADRAAASEAVLKTIDQWMDDAEVPAEEGGSTLNRVWQLSEQYKRLTELEQTNKALYGRDIERLIRWLDDCHVPKTAPTALDYQLSLIERVVWLTENGDKVAGYEKRLAENYAEHQAVGGELDRAHVPCGEKLHTFTLAERVEALAARVNTDDRVRSYEKRLQAYEEERRAIGRVLDDALIPDGDVSHGCTLKARVEMLVAQRKPTIRDSDREKLAEILYSLGYRPPEIDHSDKYWDGL